MNKLTLIIALLALFLAVTTSATGQSVPGCRILKVTDQTTAGEKHVNSFFVCPDDRVYITRREAEVIHTGDGSVAGVDFIGRFGNAALTRVPR